MMTVKDFKQILNGFLNIDEFEVLIELPDSTMMEVYGQSVEGHNRILVLNVREKD